MGQRLRSIFQIRCAWGGCALLALGWSFTCWLGISVAWGQEEPGEFPLQEPQSLLEPVTLEAVEEVATAPAVEQVAPASAPPVRLVPEPLPEDMGKAKAIRSAVEGIRPASFKEITPGESTRSDVLKKLGEPRETTSSDEGESLAFELGPFPRVEITLVNKKVTSIVIHLAEPASRAQVVEELKLDDFEPVVIRDDADRPLGEVIPERGLMFAYQADGSKDTEPQVGQVVLEQISVEPFLLRVDQTSTQQISKKLADLAVVQRLVPDDAEAYARAARLDLQCGRLAVALDAAQKAVEMDGASVHHRIVLAEINRQLGQHKEAQQAIQAVLAHGKITAMEQAEARLILGRLLATSPQHDYKQAMQETVSAIKLAAAEAGKARGIARSQARRLLVQAELSLAEILAYGPWKQRHSVVPQWLASAEKAASEHVEQDHASREILLDLYNASLHCLLVLEGQGTPSKIADAAIELGRELIAETEDAEFHSLVEWKLGTGLWHASRIYLQQGNADEALRLATNAEVLMESAAQTRPDVPETRHHLAQLQFLLGSIQAIYKRDSEMATRWYDKALPALKEPNPDALLDDRGLVGEQLVSMGIAFWEGGRRNAAVSVTEEGTSLINEAVNAGSFQRVALAIPYQNLAEMYRDLGNKEQAEKMAALAAQYEPEKEQPKQRR